MLENTENKVVFVIGEGKIYPFPIRFFDKSEIKCYVKNDNTDRELLPGEFTVEDKEDYSEGADITLVAPFSPGGNLVIMRKCPISQKVSFPLNGKFSSKNNEYALDKLTMICQQLMEESDRSIKVSPTESTVTADALLRSINKSETASKTAAAAAGESAQQAALTAKSVEAAGKAAVDAAGEAASEAAESVEEVREALRKSAGLPIGSIFSFPASVPPEGAYLLNGQMIAGCNELYPKFWEWVQSAGVRLIDNDTYEAELAKYGICGGFVIDSAAGSVRLPTWRYQAPLGETLPVRGNGMALGVTNGENNSALAFLASGGVSRVFTRDTQYGVSLPNTDTSIVTAMYNGNALGVTTDPDKSGIIAETNAPIDHFVWCIQVYNATTDLSEQESAQLASQMQMKAQTDFANVDSNIDYIIKHEEAADGSWWYDLYRNGKVVQGGIISDATGTAQTMTLPVEMADADYLAFTSALSFTTAFMAIVARTATTMDYRLSASVSGVVPYSWIIIGRAATE